MNKVFLRAEWRKLILANYEVDPSILIPFLPPKTELDTWNNRNYISLVGFQFLEVRLKGVKIPFHVNFPEVNLRFYVRAKVDGEWRRGVVFIKEIVPKPAISFVANTLYGEKYATHPVEGFSEVKGNELQVGYSWKAYGNWNHFKVGARPNTSKIVLGSEEEFITQHFWGYSKKSSTSSIEYHVEHPLWESYQVLNYQIDCDFASLYGKEFGYLSTLQPISVMLAEGSDISIYNKRII